MVIFSGVWAISNGRTVASAWDLSRPELSKRCRAGLRARGLGVRKWQTRRPLPNLRKRALCRARSVVVHAEDK